MLDYKICRQSWTPVLFYRALLLAFIVFCAACNAKVFFTKEFSFPASSRPHEPGWTYRGTVRMSSSGAWLEQNAKSIEIFVVDRSGAQVLLEKLSMSAGQLQANVVWNEANKLTIDFIEQGNAFGSGEYNAFLLRRGPSLIKKVTYDPVAAFAK